MASDFESDRNQYLNSDGLKSESLIGFGSPYHLSLVKSRKLFKIYFSHVLVSIKWKLFFNIPFNRTYIRVERQSNSPTRRKLKGIRLVSLATLKFDFVLLWAILIFSLSLGKMYTKISNEPKIYERPKEKNKTSKSSMELVNLP